MDEDGGGEVDIEEFKAWWKDAYTTSQMGNVVGAIEAVNKMDGESGKAVRRCQPICVAVEDACFATPFGSTAACFSRALTRGVRRACCR
jgi:hypothetical protein